MVGCLLVGPRGIVAEGFHRRFGGPHAEAAALAGAGPGARGATCYVTLEPCCHHGKTPPCAEALVRAGVREVVAACEDPFEPVAGRGFRALRRAGVTVRVGVRRDEARRLNAGYFKLRATGRPLVILKWAQSLDGNIATRTGDSKWISGERSRRQAHRLRRRCQAIVVGIETVLCDDPLLTARTGRGRQPLRVVLDGRLRTPADSRLAQTADRTPVLVATTRAALRDNRTHADELRRLGVEVSTVRADRGHVSPAGLLDLLGRREITNVLIEGGGRVHGSFLDAGLADRAVIFISPRLIGGAEAVRAVAGRGVRRVADAIRPSRRRVRRAGDDLIVEADLRDPLDDCGRSA